MKTNEKQIRSIAFLLVLIMFFQSCTVYKSTPISIEQVVENQSEVKIHTLNNNTYKFSAIETIDRKYFGINKSANVVIRTPLDENQMDTIKEKNKTLSIILRIGIPLVFIGLGYSYDCCGAAIWRHIN